MTKRKPVDFRTHRAPDYASPSPRGLLVTTWDTATKESRAFRVVLKAKDWPDAADKARAVIKTQYKLEIWDWCAWPLTDAQFQQTDLIVEVTA